MVKVINKNWLKMSPTQQSICLWFFKNLNWLCWVGFELDEWLYFGNFVSYLCWVVEVCYYKLINGLSLKFLI